MNLTRWVEVDSMNVCRTIKLLGKVLTRQISCWSVLLVERAVSTSGWERLWLIYQVGQKSGYEQTLGIVN